jgi:hypothetical protein
MGEMRSVWDYFYAWKKAVFKSVDKEIYELSVGMVY